MHSAPSVPLGYDRRMPQASAKKIRIRLIAVVVGILTAGFLTTNLISLRISTQSLKAALIENELPLTSSNIYSEIQADLVRPIFISSLMSHDTFVRDWLLAGEGKSEDIVRYLSEIKDKYGVFTTFLISNQTLNYYHFSGVTKAVSPHEPNDSWFFRVRDMAEDYEINIDHNAAQGNAVTIFVNYRVFDFDGNFIAATGVGLEAESVADVVSRYHENYDRNVYFVDTEGRITVRSENAALTEESLYEVEEIAPVARRILASDQDYFEYRRGGENMLVTTRYIPELRWHVMVELRESAATSEIRRGFAANLAIGLAIIVLTILCVVFVINIFQRRLETMATTDKLTGIGNRQVFDISFERAIRARQRSRLPLSIILCDIDRFKQINDRLGHLMGDEALRKITQVITGAIRETDLACRWGGEEFIILMENCGLEDALAVAEKIRKRVAGAPLFEPDDGTRLTLSAGVAEIVDGEAPDDALRRADAAVYRAKDVGRDRVERATPNG